MGGPPPQPLALRAGRRGPAGPHGGAGRPGPGPVRGSRGSFCRALLRLSLTFIDFPGGPSARTEAWHTADRDRGTQKMRGHPHTTPSEGCVPLGRSQVAWGSSYPRKPVSLKPSRGPGPWVSPRPLWLPLLPRKPPSPGHSAAAHARLACSPRSLNKKHVTPPPGLCGPWLRPGGGGRVQTKGRSRPPRGPFLGGPGPRLPGLR